MTDYLKDVPTDELAKWYYRLADTVSEKNKQACSKNQPCVGHPLAPEMLRKWLDNRDENAVVHFKAPPHLLASSEYKDTLIYHRSVFLTQKKARLGSKINSQEVWAGVLPRLKGIGNYKRWIPKAGSLLQMHYTSNVQYGKGILDIVRIELSGTPAERDLFTSLRGWSLTSNVIITGSVLPNNKVKISFVDWVCTGEDIYDFASNKELTVPNPDYKKTFPGAIRPNDEKIKVYHANAIRLQKANLAAPYKVIIDSWHPADPTIKQDAIVDTSRSL